MTFFSLALAEMKTLLVALYQQYTTTVSPAFRHMSPTATSRFELVYDDLLPIAEVCFPLRYCFGWLIPLLGQSMSCRIQETIIGLFLLLRG